MTQLLEDRQRHSVGLVDYKVGNLGSLHGALTRLGFRVVVGKTPDSLASCRALVLPGVGAAPFALATLRNSGVADFIAESFAAADRPIIGICLGMQMMFEYSEEGDVAGLGLLPGCVRRLPRGGCHVGWAMTRTPVGASSLAPPSTWREAAFYFNHSYYLDTSAEIVAGNVSLQDGTPMAALVQHGSFTGVQFHPEKSQAAGADLLRHLIVTPVEGGHA